MYKIYTNQVRKDERRLMLDFEDTLPVTPTVKLSQVAMQIAPYGAHVAQHMFKV